ncbi:MAG: hypothetical protein M3337_04855, partial [Actinomycetota bacterium]|nr:hypothetical protein [Actinomycetota bacterium]
MAVIAAIVAAAALAVLVLIASSDDAPSTLQLPSAVEAARGSDRHLELLADDIAMRVAAREQAVEAARGS